MAFSRRSHPDLLRQPARRGNYRSRLVSTGKVVNTSNLVSSSNTVTTRGVVGTSVTVNNLQHLGQCDRNAGQQLPAYSRSIIECRDRALVAFIALTGMRVRAVASLNLQYVDLAAGVVHQDARGVATKFAKTFDTFFFPIWPKARAIVDEWVNGLRTEQLFGNDDPLFPATRVALGESGSFAAVGLSRDHWSNGGPIREIFRRAFAAAGLPYFNPHSVRHTLTNLGERVCKTPEQFKAWSQNLGHEHVMTTFNVYGPVPARRQGEILRALACDDDGRKSPIAATTHRAKGIRI